jgi:hypothetical protein
MPIEQQLVQSKVLLDATACTGKPEKVPAHRARPNNNLTCVRTATETAFNFRGSLALQQHHFPEAIGQCSLSPSHSTAMAVFYTVPSVVKLSLSSVSKPLLTFSPY